MATTHALLGLAAVAALPTVLSPASALALVPAIRFEEG
jgi:hypothetical protein